jgi:hypothetical protein
MESISNFFLNGIMNNMNNMNNMNSNTNDYNNTYLVSESAINFKNVKKQINQNDISPSLTQGQKFEKYQGRLKIHKERKNIMSRINNQQLIQSYNFFDNETTIEPMTNNSSSSINNIKKAINMIDNASDSIPKNRNFINNAITTNAKNSVDIHKKTVHQLREMLNTKKTGPVIVQGPAGTQIIAIITKGGIKFDFDNKYKKSNPNRVIFSELSIPVIKKRVLENVPSKDTTDTLDNIFNKRLLRFKERQADSDWITFILMNNIDDNNDSYTTSGKNLFITPGEFSYGNHIGTVQDTQKLITDNGFKIANNNKLIVNLIKNPQLLNTTLPNPNSIITGITTYDITNKPLEHTLPHWYLCRATIIEKTASPNKLSFPFGDRAIKIPSNANSSCVFQLLDIPKHGEYNLSFYIYADSNLKFNINLYNLSQKNRITNHNVVYGITQKNIVNGGWILNNIKLSFDEKNNYVIQFINYSKPTETPSSVYLNNIVLNKSSDDYTLGIDNLEACQFKAHKELQTDQKYYGLVESTLSPAGDELIGKCIYGSTLPTPTPISQLITISHIVLFSSNRMILDQDKDNIMNNTNVLTFSNYGSLLLIDSLTKDDIKTAIYKTPIQNISSKHKGYYLTQDITQSGSNTGAADAIDIAMTTSNAYVGLQYTADTPDKYIGNYYLIKDAVALSKITATPLTKPISVNIPITEVRYEKKAVTVTTPAQKPTVNSFLKSGATKTIPAKTTTTMVDDLSKPFTVTTGYRTEQKTEDYIPQGRITEPKNSQKIWGGDGEMSVYQVNNSSNLFNMVLRNSGLFIYDGLYGSSKSKVMFQLLLTGKEPDASNYYTPKNSIFYDSSNPSNNVCYFNSQAVNGTPNYFKVGDFLCSPDGKLALILTLDCQLQIITFGTKPSNGSISGADFYEAPNIGNQNNYFNLAYIDMNGDANIYDNPNTSDSNHKGQVNGSVKYHTIPNMSYSGDVTLHENDNSCKDNCKDDGSCYGFIDDSDGYCYTMTKPYSWDKQIYKKGASLNIRQLNPSNNVLGDYGIDYNPTNTINFPIKDFEKYNLATNTFTNTISMKTLIPAILGDVNNSRNQTSNMNEATVKIINNKTDALNKATDTLKHNDNEMRSLWKKYTSITGTKGNKENFVVNQEGLELQNIDDFDTSIDNIINNKNTVLLQQNYNYLLFIILTFVVFIVLVIVLYK